MESVNDPEEGLRIFCRDHRFEEFPFAMGTVKIAAGSCDADGRKPLVLRGDGDVMIGDRSGDGEGQFVSEMGLPDPERLGLKLLQGGLD